MLSTQNVKKEGIMKERMWRKKVPAILVITISFCLICSHADAAGDKKRFPNKPIDIIVPFSVGGGTDIWMRTFAVALAGKKSLRTPINIRTMPGAATLRGAGMAFKAKPDGYTLFACNPPSTPWAWYVHQPPFDMRKFVGISVYAREPGVIVVRSDSKYKDYQDLANAFKKGELKLWTSLQKGTLFHIASLLMQKRDILDWEKYVAYKGCSDVVAALLRKEVECGVCTVTSLQNSILDGKLRPIAIVGFENRLKAFPDTPTLNELGKNPLLETTLRRCVFAPPGTPKDIQQILEKAFTKAQDNIIVQARYKSLDLVPARGTGAEAEKTVLETIQVAEDLKLREIVGKK
jgi:tripartite-type tricarboxylate transporter receptor subunit TctC